MYTAIQSIRAIRRANIKIKAIIHGQKDPSLAVPTNVYFA